MSSINTDSVSADATTNDAKASNKGPSILRIDFQELYERHLCRHSQRGINVAHLLTVVGSYLALFGIAARLLPGPGWVLWLLAIPYGVLLACNVPPAVLVVSMGILAGILGVVAASPLQPVWLCLLVIVLCHYLQNVSHRIWVKERDMSAFKQKYRKGVHLFLLLSVYELPILVNYLFVDRPNESRPRTEGDEREKECMPCSDPA
jgi:hypothetical protein